MKLFSFKYILYGFCLITILLISYQVYYFYNQSRIFSQQLTLRKDAIEKNPNFLLYKSLNQETKTSELLITGTIPNWIEGNLIRIGPSKFETSQQPIQHAFDGFAMVHAFTFKNGNVAYANKFLQTNYYKNAYKTGYISNGFDSDPCKSTFSCIASFFNKKTSLLGYDNANINIIKLANDFIAMTETPLGIIFDNDLNTKDNFNFNQNVKGQVTTAHPHIDYDTNKLINYITHFSKNSTYNIYSIELNSKEQTLIASVPAKEPSYMHSFALTQNYIILTEIPLQVHPLKIIFTCKPFIKNFIWKPENSTFFTVVNRQTGKLIGRYPTEPLFMFHHINAFEENNNIIIDLVAYNNPQIINNFLINEILLSSPHKPINFNPSRYTLNISNGSISIHKLTTTNLEMPRINYKKYNMKPYKFVYGISGWETEDKKHSLIKLNIQNESIIQWSEENCYPSEPIFIEAPNSKTEDEGVIISIVLDTYAQKSFLLILDAQSMKEIARAQVPHHIPLLLHGNFYTN